jgi:hypothetical protein
MYRLHRRLARIAFNAGDDLGLVLAGGYAISAHRLTERPSRDIDLATASRLPLQEITDRLASAYRAEGFTVALVESTPLMARIEVTVEGEVCEVDLLKEAIGPPVLLDVGPVLALDDAVGLKVGALHDRATHRDFIDVHAANVRGGFTLNDLERLGAAHLPDFSLTELMDRLGAVELRDDAKFFDYGLSEADVHELRIWAAGWVVELRQRAASDDAIAGRLENGPDWDKYLDQ